MYCRGHTLPPKFLLAFRSRLSVFPLTRTILDPRARTFVCPFLFQYFPRDPLPPLFLCFFVLRRSALVFPPESGCALLDCFSLWSLLPAVLSLTFSTSLFALQDLSALFFYCRRVKSIFDPCLDRGRCRSSPRICSFYIASPPIPIPRPPDSVGLTSF